MGSVIVCLGGDVMTGRGIDQILPHPSSPEIFESWVHDAREYVRMAEEASGPIQRPVDYEYVWGDALGALRSSALGARIVNLETSVTRNGEPWPGKQIQYRMHPGNVPCLTAARIDVCVLANNHALDWGRGALVQTLETLHRAGLKTAGAGRTLAEAEEPAQVELAEGRVLVFGAGDVSSGIPFSWEATAHRAGVALVPTESEPRAAAIAERVSRCKRKGDLVVASLHWGPNWGYEVNEAHRRFAHRLIDRGVDLVHGHSAHHPRPIEIYRDKLILYGCGDLLNDYEGIPGVPDIFRGDLVVVYFPRLEIGTGELLDLRMIPMRVHRMRLERASDQDTAWLARKLDETSRPYETRVERSSEGELVATPV